MRIHFRCLTTGFLLLICQTVIGLETPILSSEEEQQIETIGRRLHGMLSAQDVSGFGADVPATDVLFWGYSCTVGPIRQTRSIDEFRAVLDSMLKGRKIRVNLQTKQILSDVLIETKGWESPQSHIYFVLNRTQKGWFVTGAYWCERRAVEFARSRDTTVEEDLVDILRPMLQKGEIASLQRFRRKNFKPVAWRSCDNRRSEDLTYSEFVQRMSRLTKDHRLSVQSRTQPNVAGIEIVEILGSKPSRKALYAELSDSGHVYAVSECESPIPHRPDSEFYDVPNEHLRSLRSAINDHNFDAWTKLVRQQPSYWAGECDIWRNGPKAQELSDLIAELTRSMPKSGLAVSPIAQEINGLTHVMTKGWNGEAHFRDLAFDWHGETEGWILAGTCTMTNAQMDWYKKYHHQKFDF
jgi:hypothetical protein